MQQPRHLRPTTLKKFLFGVSYYPEHWNERERDRDPALIAQAGVNVVRMGEFAWSVIEPRENVFEISLFDQTIEKMAAVGIKTIFCTPTATPPIWLTQHHPDWFRVDENNQKMQHGTRQHICTTNPAFQAHSNRISRILAEHYRDNPHVIGWQTDNELNCAMNLCYCSACEKAFKTWVRQKYDTIDALNKAWGTVFWSQTYDDFEQIPLPYKDIRPSAPNPSHLLDFYRFVSDMVIDFQQQQVAILRQANPDWFILHNGLFPHIDYWRFSEDLDFLGVDIYPSGNYADPKAYICSALLLEQCRCAAGNFIVPEQQGGFGGWHNFWHYALPPGRMRMWTYQSIGHGADGVMHFRWRSCRFGAEIYWHGILDHDDIPRRRYEEFSQEGEELSRIGSQLLGTVRDVQVGILFETDQEDAHDSIARNQPAPSQQTTVAYEFLSNSHYAVGLVHVRDQYDGLKLILIPSLPMMDKPMVDKLMEYVKGGGVVLMTARSACRSRDNHAATSSLPYLLTSLFGVTVEEYGMIPDTVMGLQVDETLISSGAFYEILSPVDAKAVGIWKNKSPDEYNAASDKPAIVCRRFGQGWAIYVGTYLTTYNVASIINVVLRKTTLQLQPLANAPAAVEIMIRYNAERKLIFLINHASIPQTVENLPEGLELIGQRNTGNSIVLEPYGVRVIKTRRDGEQY